MSHTSSLASTVCISASLCSHKVRYLQTETDTLRLNPHEAHPRGITPASLAAYMRSARPAWCMETCDPKKGDLFAFPDDDRPRFEPGLYRVDEEYPGVLLDQGQQREPQRTAVYDIDLRGETERSSISFTTWTPMPSSCIRILPRPMRHILFFTTPGRSCGR